MTDKQPITEDDRIELMANPNWIKYIRCKKCYMEYEIEIASNACLKCGGHDFEQFDLILYPMSVEQKQQILNGQKALEELPITQIANITLKHNFDTISKNYDILLQENQKLKETITSLEKELMIRTQPISYNEDLLQENQKLKETIARLDSEKSHIITLYGNLKVEIEELKTKLEFWKDLKQLNESQAIQLAYENEELEQKIEEMKKKLESRN